jgi:NodT family efflux transporter outer membrane factor (OMF) lipoprotein
MSIRPIILGALSVAVLGACANFDGLSPRARLGDPNRLDSRATFAAVKTDAPWPAAEWWRALGDPQLDRLMSEALAGNPDLGIARARVDRATAFAGLADAARYPQVNGRAETTYQRFSANGLVPPPLAGSYDSFNQLALTFSYEFDFWGKNEATFQSALGQVKVAQAEEQQARLLLSSALAQTYIQLQLQFEQLDIAEALLRQREQLLELTRRRVGAGLDSNVELNQASAAIPAAQADIEAIREQTSLLRNQLAALAGAGPDRGAAIERPTVMTQKELSLPGVLPADLIGRRPDVVAALWRVEAAAKDIDVAKAEFYPNVDLLAIAGVQAIGYGKLFNGGSGIIGAGPALHLPIFDAGSLRSQLAGRDADFDAAAEQYNAIIVGAVRDVADQIASWRGIAAQLTQTGAALGRFEEAYRLAVLRYREGLSNYVTVLIAETQVLAQQRLMADLQARQKEAAVGLVRALGGGYRPEALPPSAELRSSAGGSL